MPKPERVYIRFIIISVAANLFSVMLLWMGGMMGPDATNWLGLPFWIVNFPLTALLEKTSWVPEGSSLLVVIGTTTVLHSSLLCLILLPKLIRNPVIK